MEGILYQQLQDNPKENYLVIYIDTESADNENEFWQKLFNALLEEEFVNKLEIYSKNLWEKFTNIKIEKITTSAVNFGEGEVLDYSQPFYEFFKIIKLKGFTLEESKTFLLALANKNEKKKIQNIIKNDSQRIEIIRRLTGGVPRTLVMLFDIFLDEKGDSFEDLLKILDEVTPLYKHRMDDLPAQLQDIVHTIAINWDGIFTKEIALKTRMQSKAISAQLKKYEIVEARTVGKNKIYKIKERFFNIWYLMRFGRKKDRQRVEWLIAFLTSWCTKEELENKAEGLITKLKDGQVKVSHAFHMTEALRHSDLSLKIETDLTKELKTYLKKIDSNFFDEISQTDSEVILKSLDLRNENKIDEAILLLKKSKSSGDMILFYITEFYYDKKDFEKSENYHNKLFKNNNKTLNSFYFSMYLLERNKFAHSYIKIEEFIKKNLNNKNILYITVLLLFLISKKQYLKAKEFLEDKEYNFKEKLKPIWFALMTLMQKEYPNEIKKMGSELEESVSDILKDIKKLEKDNNSQEKQWNTLLYLKKSYPLF